MNKKTKTLKTLNILFVSTSSRTRGEERTWCEQKQHLQSARAAHPVHCHYSLCLHCCQQVSAGLDLLDLESLASAFQSAKRIWISPQYPSAIRRWCTGMSQKAVVIQLAGLTTDPLYPSRLGDPVLKTHPSWYMGFSTIIIKQEKNIQNGDTSTNFPSFMNTE